MGEQSQASGWQGVSDWYLSATCIACIVYCANMGNIMFLLHHFGSSPSAVENVVQINFILSIINIFATGMVIKLHLFYMVPRSCCFTIVAMLCALLLSAPPLMFTILRDDWDKLYAEPLPIIIYGCNGTDTFGLSDRF